MGVFWAECMISMSIGQDWHKMNQPFSPNVLQKPQKDIFRNKKNYHVT